MHGNADSLSRRPCDANCKHCSKRDNSQELCRRTTVDSEMEDDDLAEKQRKDADLAPIIEHMKECCVRPPWKKISATSTVTKGYWSQWDLLRLKDGDQEAATVARVLVDNFFCRFGMPMELHSDQGRNFKSALLKECCDLLGIKKTRTTLLGPV